MWYTRLHVKSVGIRFQIFFINVKICRNNAMHLCCVPDCMWSWLISGFLFLSITGDIEMILWTYVVCPIACESVFIRFLIFIHRKRCRNDAIYLCCLLDCMLNQFILGFYFSSIAEHVEIILRTYVVYPIACEIGWY